MHKSTILLVVVGCLLGGCLKHDSPYDFDFPSVVVHLPEELNEISGLDMINDSTIACVQDEEGAVYLLDTHGYKVTSKLTFDRKGDYEGIAKFGEFYYVLQSDGDILKVDTNGIRKKVKFDGCKKSDFEGLCLDSLNNRLLVACKQPCKKKDANNILIYGYSLEKDKYLKHEVFRLDKKDVHKNFKASGIAIHPNGNIYLLSSFSKTLLVLSGEGKKVSKTQLNGFIFHQPEGITFSSKGDLYISNERNETQASIMKMNF